MSNELWDSLYDLYEQGGLELFLEGTRGIAMDVVGEKEAVSETNRTIISPCVSPAL